MKENDVAYAGFWLRVVAMLIDTGLVVLIITPLINIYGANQDEINALLARSFDEMRQMDPQLLIMDLKKILASKFSGFNLLLSCIFPAIAAIIFWKYKSATPGKMIVKIVDAKTGGRPSMGQCLIRYLGYYIAFLSCGLGIILVAFDDRKQGLHDKLAGTLVIKTKRKSESA